MTANIAIDGPAGAGKSTVARRVARELSFIYVDTGAMYRAMALYLIRQKIDAQDTAGIEEACGAADITIVYQDGEQQVLLNGENVNGVIRTQEVSSMASVTSSYPVVREKLLELQRSLAADTDVIMDGRDIGTCVLPGAQVKIFLTASSATRAKRRYDELTEKGETCDLAEIEREIIARDERDMNRETAPLKQADDAVFVDSSYMDIEQVVNTLLGIYREKTGK